MGKQYSDAFVEQALIKAYSRGDRSVRSIAEEVNVEYETLRKWMQRKSLDKAKAIVKKEKRPQDWRRDEQLAALMQTHGLSEEALNAWCRERGIFPHHLKSWEANFCAPEAAPASTETQGVRALKSENDKLKQELRRKEKALAEAAALLVLQKKFRALWDNEDK
jgi:transposase-like protein